MAEMVKIRVEYPDGEVHELEGERVICLSNSEVGTGCIIHGEFNGVELTKMMLALLHEFSVTQLGSALMVADSVRKDN